MTTFDPLIKESNSSPSQFECYIYHSSPTRFLTMPDSAYVSTKEGCFMEDLVLNSGISDARNGILVFYLLEGRASSSQIQAGKFSIQQSLVSSKAVRDNFPEMKGIDLIKWILK